MPINKQAIEHFKHKGRVLADSHVADPLPEDLSYVIRRMKRISRRSLMGTENPLGGDLPTHLAYLEFRDAWAKKQAQLDE